MIGGIGTDGGLCAKTGGATVCVDVSTDAPGVGGLTPDPAGADAAPVGAGTVTSGLT